jgi:hypothetical protein
MSVDEKELDLSFLDRQSHIRVYGRYYIVFSFPDINRADAAITSLRMGFKEVLKRFPYLAGTVRMPYVANNSLQVLFPDPIDLEAEASRVFTASLDQAMNTAYDYNKLARTHFLPENLPAKVFCPALIKHHPGLDDDDPFAEGMISLTRGPLPTFAAHATWIPGGLVLSVWFYHAIIDGAGNARIQEVWSAAVKSLNAHTQKNGSSTTYLKRIIACDATDATIARSQLAILAHELNNGHTVTRPKRRLHRSANPLHETPYKVVTKMFRFPDSTISSLSKAISDLKETHISKFSAVASLVWANIIQARLPRLIASGNTKSTLAVVVDLRRHLREPFSSPDYLGNLVLSEMPTWDLFEQADSIIVHTIPAGKYSKDDIASGRLLPNICVAHLQINIPNLAYFATKIRDAVHSIDAEWVGRKFHQILTDPKHTDHAFLTFPNGPDLYITSWQHIGADREWCIPGTADTQPTAIRRAAWVSEGGIVLLPRKKPKEGNEPAAYEVLVSLAEKDMKGFEESLEEGKWLMDRC